MRKERFDGCRSLWINDGPGMFGPEKRSVPVFGAIGCQATVIGQHHKRRQVIVHTPKAITDPTTHAGKSWQIVAGSLQQRGLAMDTCLADHIMHERHVIGTDAQIGYDLTQHFAALTVRLELPDRFLPRPETILECFNRFSEIRRLAMPLDQLGFEIPQIDMAGRPRHE